MLFAADAITLWEHKEKWEICERKITNYAFIIARCIEWSTLIYNRWIYSS